MGIAEIVYTLKGAGITSVLFSLSVTAEIFHHHHQTKPSTERKYINPAKQSGVIE